MYAKIADGKRLDDLIALFLGSQEHPALRYTRVKRTCSTALMLFRFFEENSNNLLLCCALRAYLIASCVYRGGVEFTTNLKSPIHAWENHPPSLDMRCCII